MYVDKVSRPDNNALGMCEEGAVCEQYGYTGEQQLVRGVLGTPSLHSAKGLRVDRLTRSIQVPCNPNPNPSGRGFERASGLHLSPFLPRPSSQHWRPVPWPLLLRGGWKWTGRKEGKKSFSSSFLFFVFYSQVRLLFAFSPSRGSFARSF